GADPRPRVEAAAGLADQDVPGAHQLAAELLDAAVLGPRVAAVLDRALPFFVCHRRSPAARSGGDRGDLDFGVGLPVALLLAVVGARAELVDDELPPAAVADDLALDLGPLDQRLA